ncbi:hypothetical protein SVAN01_09776 [Stagonosporopsis vannaccii]|nr:hypothetical protein SVAN01_09776 [Stagonosporopsis vannaccii]
MSHSRPIPHPHLVHTHIHIHTLQLIAALLLTLMLLWHISTITLVENYEMPEWWVRDFLAEHAKGWRLGVWGAVGVFVVADCVIALAGLDWWCGVLEQRTVSVFKDEGAGQTYQRPFSCYIHASSTTRAPRAHAQPSTRRSRPTHRTRVLLLSAFDLLMLAVLAGHSVTYFVSLPTAIAFCSLPAVLASPDQAFGVDKVQLSVRDRCCGLNVDIHVAGGFAVFMALVLGLLHLAGLVVRGWDGMVGVIEREHQQGGQMSAVDSAVSESGVLSSRGSYCISASRHSTAAGGPRIRNSSGPEEGSAGIRFVNWSDEGAGRTARHRAACLEESEAPQWSEVFLECLIDA